MLVRPLTPRDMVARASVTPLVGFLSSYFKTTTLPPERPRHSSSRDRAFHPCPTQREYVGTTSTSRASSNGCTGRPFARYPCGASLSGCCRREWIYRGKRTRRSHPRTRTSGDGDTRPITFSHSRDDLWRVSDRRKRCLPDPRSPRLPRLRETSRQTNRRRPQRPFDTVVYSLGSSRAFEDHQ